MSFGAGYRGLIDYQCHGGVVIIAAPVPVERPDGIQVIVASPPFGSTDTISGWKLVEDHARGIGVGIGPLREAYFKLPPFDDYRARVARNLVEMAAFVLADALAGKYLSSSSAGRGGAGSRRAEEDELNRMLQRGLFVASDVEPGTRENGGGRLVAMVKEMVRRNPALPFSVQNVARAANMTPNHLSASFRKHAGETFSRYLIEQRLSLARNLLRDLTLNIAQVSAQCGFSDTSYFVRRFKKATGKTPREWRRAL
jgi:AraC-like DNA-binding protein